ncbi:MAG TPA: hypothetical protein VGQ57_04015 [Polyangiaceae bacterium]|jgi:hypothetical protein|nr:hypothetical protein [Polyangiaceae bacterium]
MTLATTHFCRWFLASHSGRGVERVVLALIASLVVVLTPSPAHAAAPMCSSDGRSVVAPPSILPWRQQTLEAPTPCPLPENQLLRSMPEEQQRAPSSAPSPAPLRAMPVRPVELSSPKTARTAILDGTRPVGVPRVSVIYRPPRA